jgi:hypothetical protein
MAVQTRLQGVGIVADISVREGVSKKSGEVYRIVNALIVGAGTLVELRVPDSLEKDLRDAHKSGVQIRIFCTVSTWNDEDQAELTKIEPVG